MLLDWISDEMALISSSPEKNMLKDYPLTVKRVVVGSVVKYFDSQHDEAIKTLLTQNHVNWVMEIIGQSFQLPIEDHEIINQAIHIYHKWLFYKDKQPAPMKENEQYFIREIFRHFSFLFEVRPNQSQAVLKSHLYLCNRVMDIFLSLGVQDILDEESWNHVLKIVLGITDLMLRGNKGLIELNYGLLKVLFELWLCSLSYDKSMWDHLQKYVVQWGKHMATVKQWSSVCMALTLRVVNLLYGPTEGTPIVSIHWTGLNPTNNPNPNVGNPITELDLPDEYVYFAWNMFLHILGNPNKLLDPEIHLRAFQGLQSISRQLAHIGYDVPIEKLRQNNQELRIPYAPDGNSILEIFGSWFYEAVNRPLPVYNEGRSVAYSALCKIYCRKGGQPFTKNNLALFYNAIIKGLQEDNNYIISSIMMNSCKLFNYELEGSHILIPHYIKTCEKILCSEQKIKMERGYIDPIRSAAITLLSSLLSTSNFYKGSAKSTQNMIYVELKFQIEKILGVSLMMETNPRNIQHILWLIQVYIYEEIGHNREASHSFVIKFLDLIKRHGAKPTKEYTPDVFITIYEVLSGLTPLYPQLAEADSNIARDIVEQIALTIPILVSGLKTSPVHISLVVEAFYCLCDWIMAGCERVIPDKALMANIISAVEIGLNADTLTKRDESEIEPIKIAAEYTLCHMLNRVGQFPPTSETAQVSSSLTEKSESFDNLALEASEYSRIFMFDNMFLVSVIDQPVEKNGPGVTLIVRDITGKYAWDSRVLYGDLPPAGDEIEPHSSYMGSTSDGLTGHTEEHPSNERLMKFSQPPPISDRPGVDGFEALIAEMDNMENEFNAQKILSLATMDISVKPPTTPNKHLGECKFQMSRLLLSHFGFLNADVLNSITYDNIDPRFVQLQCNNKVLRSLRTLDATAERDCHKIGVVYVAEGQDQQQEILENSESSDRFKRFVSSLGWNVELKNHNGFIGGLSKNGSCGTHAPYFADYKMEAIFHVSTMMPTVQNDPQQLIKKRHIGNDHTNIIWTEHTRDYYRNTIVSHFNFIHIVLYPLPSGLVRVDVLCKDKDKTPPFGPLTDGMVISEHVLGALVRQTAISGNRVVRRISTGYTRPFVGRKKLFYEISSRYKMPLTESDFFATLFVPKAIAAKVGEESSIARKKRAALADSGLSNTGSSSSLQRLGSKKMSALSSRKK